jgi:hypothetical protein
MASSSGKMTGCCVTLPIEPAVLHLKYEETS